MNLRTVFDHPERIVETDRYRRIARLDAYYRGTQYNHLPDWYTGLSSDGEQVPLRERRPCVISKLPAGTVRQAVRFTLGEGRFPKIAVDPMDAAEAVGGVGLSEDEAGELTKFVEALAKNACLKTVAMQLMRTALSCSSAAAVASVRRGRFTWDLPKPQAAWPFFLKDDPQEDVDALVWCYPFIKTVEEQGQLVSRLHYFRRDYGPESFTVYKDALASTTNGAWVEWQIDTESTKPNSLGFVPVVWLRNEPDPSCFDIDGAGLYESHLDDFDALSFALSQQHRTINYHGAPQPYETGVDEDERPGAIGRQARPVRAERSAANPSGAAYNAVMEGPFGVNPKPARKIAPDTIWTYHGKAEVGLLETSGKAFEIGDKHARNIRSRILEAMSIVMMDPDGAAKQDLSGKALARIYAPLLALVDDLREHYWDQMLARMISVMLRMVAVLGGKGIMVPGAESAAKILNRFFIPFDGETIWVPPQMTPAWGDYFSTSPEDTKIAVETAAQAKSEGLVKASTATAYVAPYFSVNDAEAEAEEVEEEATEKADSEKETLHAAQKALAKIDESETPDPITGTTPTSQEIEETSEEKEGE